MSVHAYFQIEDTQHSFAKVARKASTIPQVAIMRHFNPHLAIKARPISLITLNKTMANCNITLKPDEFRRLNSSLHLSWSCYDIPTGKTLNSVVTNHLVCTPNTRAIRTVHLTYNISTFHFLATFQTWAKCLLSQHSECEALLWDATQKKKPEQGFNRNCH